MGDLTNILGQQAATPDAGSTFAEAVADANSRRAARPWSALICGMPGDGTMLIVDWLVLACRQLGFAAEATPLGGGDGEPHGMYVEVARNPAEEELLGDAPHEGVDLLVAGEHLELARAIAHGFAHPGITTTIASCRRAFTQAEHVTMAHHVLDESEIDELAAINSQRYIAFDGREVAGWYRLPERIEPALLFGALCGSGALGLDENRCRDAIARLGIDVQASLRALRHGTRFGRRNGGRVRRALTAAQFVRKRRSGLARNARAGFEALITRIDQEFVEQHRPALREAVYTLTDYQDATYAQQLLDQVLAVAREEQLAAAARGEQVDPTRSLVPAVTRGLCGILAYPDLPHIAHVKLGASRLPELRKRHGVARRDVYELRDHLPIDAYERAQLAPPSMAARIDRTGSPLRSHSRIAVVTTTSLAGAMQLKRLRKLRTRRPRSERHALELDLAQAYVQTVTEALHADRAIAELVAASGSLVHGYGATRAATRTTAHIFWGRVVRQAFAVDRSARNGSYAFSSIVIPHVYAQLCRSGPLALWEYASPVLGIALHTARGGSYEEALHHAEALCSGSLAPGESAPALAQVAAEAPPAAAELTPAD